MRMQSRIVRFAVMTLLAGLFATPGSADDAVPKRYRHAVEQYASLSPAERNQWLQWLEASAAGATQAASDTEQRDATGTDPRDFIKRRGNDNDRLTDDQLVAALRSIDQRQQARIVQLAQQFRQAARAAAGVNEWEFQRRMKMASATKRVCDGSPYPFEGQVKLIDWIEAAILEQRISSRPPLPPTPDFQTVDAGRWRAKSDKPVAEVHTSLESADGPLTAAELQTDIARYNADMARLVARLYPKQTWNVTQLDAAVDKIAQLGLTRVGLAASSLQLSEQERASVPRIETLDSAIALARVKDSAARRISLREAHRHTISKKWDELKALNHISRRLDTLASGPDR